MNAKSGEQGKTQRSGVDRERDRTDARSGQAGSRRGLRARLGRAVRAGADQVADNPLAAVAGAAAVSAGLALLLPSTRREAEVMGEMADKLADVAREAADGVVAAGQSQVETLAQSAIASVAGAALEAVVSGQATTPGGR